jgi:predicted DNA-binding transcriptional regulator AlpA
LAEQLGILASDSTLLRQLRRGGRHGLAPQAAQVADRWHLLHNMSEALFGALVPHHRLLTEVAQVIAARAKAATSPDAQLPLSAKPPSRKQRAQEENRERRLARYEAVMEQLRQGTSQREIARSCGLRRQTVRRWISARSFPERRPSSHATTVDQHQGYLEQRWQQGCHNAAQLWRELREQGFTGQSRIVRDWIRKHCGSRRCRVGQQPFIWVVVDVPPPRSSSSS